MHAAHRSCRPLEMCFGSPSLCLFSLTPHPAPQRYAADLEAVQRLYEKHKAEPPVARNAPPVAGKIQWARHLLHRIEAPMQRFREREAVLAAKDSKKVFRTYNRLAQVRVVCSLRVGGMLHADQLGFLFEWEVSSSCFAACACSLSGCAPEGTLFSHLACRRCWSLRASGTRPGCAALTTPRRSCRPCCWRRTPPAVRAGGGRVHLMFEDNSTCLSEHSCVPCSS